MKYSYQIYGTCSKEVSFDLDGDIVTNISFTRGCDGNLKAVASLADGLSVKEINAKCLNIKCRNSTSSCAAQFAMAVNKAYNAVNTANNNE